MVALCCVWVESFAQLPAFPGAEGWGAQTKGGRGGVVLHVTNLNDSGEGSFRAAVDDPRPRIIVFDVSGTIELKSGLTVSQPFCTIAGQTAPGDGICLKNASLRVANTHDVIIRAIRVRPGAGGGIRGAEVDGIGVSNSENVIVDHCVASWSLDEGFNTWHKARNITYQWCVMSEALNNSIHEKGRHGFGGSIGGYKASFHHNIFANCIARNPSIGGNDQNLTIWLDFRNCVISNWEHRTCDGKPLSVNLVNNYYKPGPATQPDVCRRVAKIDYADSKWGFSGQWYIQGNVIEGYPEISADNWKGGVDYEPGASMERNRRYEPFKVAPVVTQPAKEAYELVLKYAGCYTNRDSQEKRIIEQIRTGKYHSTPTGIIDTVEQAGGWPVLKSTPKPLDTDNDGMPDAWEKQNGLNPNNPADAAQEAANGYTNVENYINSLLPDVYTLR